MLPAIEQSQAGEPMRRRAFITAVAGATLAQLHAARAQQPAMPVIGFLSLRSSATGSTVNVAFLEGLKETGFVEGRNVAIAYRWAAGDNDRFPELAADLVRSKVDVIVAAGGNPSALAAQVATAEIPIVFQMGADPVALGLVKSLEHPGGNLTGVISLNVEVGPKRLELLREVVPAASVFGLLVDPKNAASGTLAKQAQATAASLGLELKVEPASTEGELDAALARLIQVGIGGLVIGNDPFFAVQSAQLANLCTRDRLPSIATRREYPAVGGLMSYGGSLTDVFRLAGVFTGRILKGEKPAEMPIHKSSKLELVINKTAAERIGLAMPANMLARADEVIS